MKEKILLIVILGVLVCNPNCLFSQCISGDCNNGAGVYKMEDGSRYIGQFKNGTIEGIGTCIYPDGSSYQGKWNNGKPQGEGTKYFKDGTTLSGLWVNGQLSGASSDREFSDKGGGSNRTKGCINGNCANGDGVFIFESGAIYIGSFQNGEIHGVGVCMYPDGSKYQGEWQSRYPEGNGTMTYPDGSVRSGIWKKGLPVDDSGQIVVSKSAEREVAIDDGLNIQSGCLSGDCFNGKGVKAFPEGSRYEGQFAKNKPNGYGTMFYSNGNRYTGGFKNGVPHGRGTMVLKNEPSKSGEWLYGTFVGTNNSTKALLGCKEGDCMSGFGTYLYKDGSKYVGTFKSGLAEGYGTVMYPNGDKYTGQMKSGAFDGVGTLTRGGRNFKGMWQQGMYLGEAPDRSTSKPSNNNNGLRQPKIWALVVGIASYDHMPTLNYTDDDAYRFFAFLKSPEGGALSDDQIKILIDEDATKKNILAFGQQIFAKAGPDDVVIFYFSGHGLKGSFLPIDYNGHNNKLQHTEVKSLLDNSRAKLKLCIADACHSGSLLTLRSGTLGNELEEYYNKLAESKPGTVLIMSSKSDETSLESSGLRQGVFSHFLIRGLKGEADANGNGFVEVQELFGFIQNNVRSYTRNRQFPIMKGTYDPNTPLAKKL